MSKEETLCCPRCGHNDEIKHFYDHYGDFECPICGWVEGEE